jgi:hypothetical protein
MHADRRTMRWDRLTGVASVVIAACALGVSWHAVRYTETVTELAHANAKANVRPVLMPWYPVQAGDYQGLGIRNVGLGPARVRSVELFWESRPLSAREFIAKADELCPEGRKQFNFLSHEYIPEGQTVLMAGVAGCGVPMDAATLIGLQYRIEYESALGERSVLDTRERVDGLRFVTNKGYSAPDTRHYRPGPSGS